MSPKAIRLSLRRISGVLSTIVVCGLSACSQSWENTNEERTYKAYGTTWQYTSIERHITKWGFGSPHGLLGEKEATEQEVYLTSASGKRIPVHKSIVALQKNGSYKTVDCCNSVSTMVNVYNFNEKLILSFIQTRENVTDCFIYPANQPNDETKPPDERARYVTLLGELDPQKEIFRVNAFFPGGLSFEEVREKFGNRASMAQTTELVYSRRKPFICE